MYQAADLHSSTTCRNRGSVESSFARSARGVDEVEIKRKGIKSMRTATTTASLILWLGILSFGCQSAIKSKSSSSGQSSHAGGSSGQGGIGAQGETGGTPAQASESLTLVSATAHVDGRSGQNVRISVTGKQVAAGLASVGVTALDASGTPLYWFSTRHDSEFDSATGYLVPELVPTEADFSFDIVVPFANATLNWTQTKIVLFDRADAVSNELLVPIQAQPVQEKDETCDAAAKSNRCDTGLDCNATSNTCVKHAGPSLTQVAYLTTTAGTVILGFGSDNADDVRSMNIDFYDASGAPVGVDLTNDTTSPVKATSFLETGGLFPDNGVYSFAITPAETFSAIVKKVGLTPTDSLGLSASTLTTSLTSQPSRGSGQTCSIYGFDYCSGSAACSPGLSGVANTCQPIGSAQGKACGAAPTIDLGKAETFLVTGYNQGASLWEPPTDCVSTGGLGQPESVVKLYVPTKTATLTLSTDRRETQTDTVVYVLSACGSASPKVFGCNDDGPVGNSTSSLTLTDVAPGTYYVVVDSASGGGGPFGLVATLQ